MACEDVLTVRCDELRSYGPEAAVFLALLRRELEASGSGEVALSADFWRSELRLSRHMVVRVRERLRRAGVIRCRRGGLPCRTLYSVVSSG